MLTPEQLIENYEKFVDLAKKTGDDRQEALAKFFDHFGQRLAECPASSRTDYHSAYPGGLVEHSLRVVKFCNRLVQVYKDTLEINKEEMIFACLFHDIGKIGDLEHERYLPQTSSYWAERGRLYEYNPKMSYLSTPHMGIFILQQMGVRVSFAEFQGILLNDGMYAECNREYGLKECPLALLVHQADVMATRVEKPKSTPEEGFVGGNE